MDVKINRKNHIVNIDTVTTATGNNYEIGDYINQGGNAVVHECIDINGNVFAIKFLMVCSDKMKTRFEQEISVLKKLKHSHWVQFVDDGFIPISLSKNSTPISIRFIIMERADTNLVDFLKSSSSIEYDVYAPQFRGLSEALSELHQYEVVHRDIKPENILIKGEKWMLSDLGLCTVCSDDDHLDITSENEKIGPKFWLSPEVVNKIYFQEDIISYYSDVYQLCAVFWFIVTKKHPYGLLYENDWNNDLQIFNIIIKSLAHDYSTRPQNGTELYGLFCAATIHR